MKIDARNAALVILIATFLTSASGCRSYNARWEQAAAAPADGIAGRWSGTWSSHTSSHGGGLRCIVTRVDDDAYRAHFHATFKLLFIPCGFQQAVDLVVSEVEDGWSRFEGGADLGWPWGAFSHEGRANAERFESAYTSKFDRGVFEMEKEKN